MGVASSLFVILMIPELWKNRSCGCMEIEAASCYSLRIELGGNVTTTAVVIIPFYTVVCLMFQPVLYKVYKETEIK